MGRYSGSGSGTQKVEVTSPLESNGAIPINIQDQHTPTFDLFFTQDVGSATTLTTDAIEDAYVMSVTTGHGLVAADEFVIIDTATQRGFVASVVSVAGDNTVNVDRPLPATFPFATSTLQQKTSDLNVDGSSTRQTFTVSLPSLIIVELDITRFMFQMITATAVDLSKFGDLTALSRGCVLRVINGQTSNLQNFKSNAEMALMMFDLKLYDATNPGQGLFGLTGKLDYAGPENHGVTIRIGAGESVEFIIQDNLTGLTSFKVTAAGHIVTD